MTDPCRNPENERLEIRLLLECIFQKSGFDFRDYAFAHIKRRLEHVRKRHELASFSEMTHRLIYDPDFFEAVLTSLSINVTEMFRDPSFYLAVRDKVFPLLKTYPFIRIWHAGCATGQEVYSLAIMLQEDGLKERSQIYATDINAPILDAAKQAIYPLSVVKQYTANYQKAGGTSSFSDYYSARYESASIVHSLKKDILFSLHNLATDGVFGEMNLIFCRNVLIYFNETLQNRVVKLFRDSLCSGGFLCLGSKESLRFSRYAEDFEVIDAREKIYRKRRRRTESEVTEP